MVPKGLRAGSAVIGKHRTEHEHAKAPPQGHLPVLLQCCMPKAKQGSTINYIVTCGQDQTTIQTPQHIPNVNAAQGHEGRDTVTGALISPIYIASHQLILYVKVQLTVAVGGWACVPLHCFVATWARYEET